VSIELDVENLSKTSVDIRNIYNPNLIVTGFFTPDYLPLAQSLSKNLSDRGVSHHIYELAKIPGDWAVQTKQKPCALVAALGDYPAQTLVLMDVDCQVRGDISELSLLEPDVTLTLKRKATKLGEALLPCSRVIVVKPTKGGATFVRSWQEACQNGSKGSDETALLRTIEQSGGSFSIGALAHRFTGTELRDAKPNAIIVHQSVHDDTRPVWSVRKAVQRIFRRVRDAFFVVFTGANYDAYRSR
jgi:hypothetical protein